MYYTLESSDKILKKIMKKPKVNNQNLSAAESVLANENAVCSICGDRGIILQGDTAIPCSCMEQRKLFNSFKYARLSRELIGCRFDSFDLDYYNSGSLDQEHSLKAQKALKAAQDFCRNVLNNPHEIGLLFSGSVGSGKTFLAAAIANVLIEQQTKLLFLVVPDLLDELRATYDSKSETSEYDLLDIARTIPVLILDDLGAHNYTDWTRNRLYTILNYRTNEQLPTIITTNLSFDEIETYLGERTCSRLLQMCRIFRLSTEKDIRRQKYDKREKLS